MYIMLQSACLVINPIAVYSYGLLSGSGRHWLKTFDGSVPDVCLWVGPRWFNQDFSLTLTAREMSVFIFVISQ